MDEEAKAAVGVRRAQFLRRAEEARRYVASVDPALLGDTGSDPTLLDLTLSCTVMQRLDAAYQHELGNAWLRGLQRADPSSRR